MLVLSITLYTLAGCTQEMYHWGDYEKSVYSYYNSPDYSLEADLMKLRQQADKIALNDNVPPPGLMAHIGYLCSQAGDNHAAREYFEAEIKYFPESSDFMNRIIASLP